MNEKIRVAYLKNTIVHNWMRKAEEEGISYEDSLENIIVDLVEQNQRQHSTILNYVLKGCSVPFLDLKEDPTNVPHFQSDPQSLPNF